MLSKNIQKLIFSVVFAFMFSPVVAQDELPVAEVDVSSQGIVEYDPTGSLFQQIVDLEQQRILLELEKEKAQLDLELDRLTAERIKLQMELDTLAGRADEQQIKLETERARLEAEAARLEREKEVLLSGAGEVKENVDSPKSATQEKTTPSKLSTKYKLIDVMGAGGQLVATIEETPSGQRRRISVGKQLDDYTVKSISLNDGVVFTRGDETETLNIAGKEK